MPLRLAVRWGRRSDLVYEKAEPDNDQALPISLSVLAFHSAHFALKMRERKNQKGCMFNMKHGVSLVSYPTISTKNMEVKCTSVYMWCGRQYSEIHQSCIAIKSSSESPLRCQITATYHCEREGIRRAGDLLFASAQKQPSYRVACTRMQHTQQQRKRWKSITMAAVVICSFSISLHLCISIYYPSLILLCECIPYHYLLHMVHPYIRTLTRRLLHFFCVRFTTLSRLCHIHRLWFWKKKHE